MLKKKNRTRMDGGCAALVQGRWHRLRPLLDGSRDRIRPFHRGRSLRGGIVQGPTRGRAIGSSPGSSSRGSANLGNGVAHALLTLYVSANAGRQDRFFVKERELGGLEGPASLTLINVAVDLLSIKARWLILSGDRDCFVAILGTLLPIVWPRFLSQGLNTWFALVKAGRKDQ